MGRKAKSSNQSRKSPVPVLSIDRNRASITHASTQDSTLSSSVLGDPSGLPSGHPSIPVESLDVGGALGAARLREANARAFANAATQDAVDIKSALLAFRAKHKKLFLLKAFGINPDGTAIADRSLVPNTIPTYRSVKTVAQYNKMIDVLSNWGDDKELDHMPRDNLEYKRIIAFCAKYPKHGYYIAREFRLEEIQNCNRSITKLLIQKKSNKIVSHMLNVYDAIWEAHARIGHLGHDKTINACSETHYSPTQQLVRIFCQDCFVCLEKMPRSHPHQGAKKPIISLNFWDRFQVDLIDMRTIRKEDVYFSNDEVDHDCKGPLYWSHMACRFTIQEGRVCCI